MGMYTEIFMRGELRGDLPAETMSMLRYLAGEKDGEVPPLPDHPFFQCDRWDYIGTMNSAYFPFESRSAVVKSGWHTGHDIVIHSQLKNYDGEIEKFFDWIDPLLHMGEGAFLGYSLYEEAERPTIYQKH
jgi:hypothetical protein